jgi:hypothetical protein
MPTAPDNHDAHDYNERVRERQPRCLQELLESGGLSNFGFARENGVRGESRLHLLETSMAHNSLSDWSAPFLASSFLRLSAPVGFFAPAETDFHMGRAFSLSQAFQRARSSACFSGCLALRSFFSSGSALRS